MSFLGRIVQQARSPLAPGHAVARPKGQVPSLRTMAPPVDRPAHTEPVASRAEPSVTAPETVPPNAAGPSDEPPPASSMPEPGPPSTTDQSALDQRLAAVAGAAGTRPEPVNATDVDRPTLPPAADTRTSDGEAFSDRDQEPVVRIADNDFGTVAPLADEQQDMGDRPTPVASAQERTASSLETSPGHVSPLRPIASVPAEASIGEPIPAATEQEARQAKSPSDQTFAGADTDQGEPQIPPAPARRAADGANAPWPESPPVFEPVPAPQRELYRPAPTIQPPASDQPPLLQIDQIDVVVTDPALAQPAAPARSRLAAISASRRYLRRL